MAVSSGAIADATGLWIRIVVGLAFPGELLDPRRKRPPPALPVCVSVGHRHGKGSVEEGCRGSGDAGENGWVLRAQYGQ